MTRSWPWPRLLTQPLQGYLAHKKHKRYVRPDCLRPQGSEFSLQDFGFRVQGGSGVHLCYSTHTLQNRSPGAPSEGSRFGGGVGGRKAGMERERDATSAPIACVGVQG